MKTKKANKTVNLCCLSGQSLLYLPRVDQEQNNMQSVPPRHKKICCRVQYLCFEVKYHWLCYETPKVPVIHFYSTTYSQKYAPAEETILVHLFIF